MLLCTGHLWLSPTPLAGLLSTGTGDVACFSACGPSWQQSRLCCDAPKAWCRALVHRSDIYETTRDCGGYRAGRPRWTGQPHSVKAPGKHTRGASGRVLMEWWGTVAGRAAVGKGWVSGGFLHRGGDTAEFAKCVGCGLQWSEEGGLGEQDEIGHSRSLTGG